MIRSMILIFFFLILCLLLLEVIFEVLQNLYEYVYIVN